MSHERCRIDQHLWAAHKVTEHLNPRFRKCLTWRIWSLSRWELERSACLPACHAHRFPVCTATGQRVALLRHRLGWPGFLPLVVPLRTGEGELGCPVFLFIELMFAEDRCRAVSGALRASPHRVRAVSLGGGDCPCGGWLGPGIHLQREAEGSGGCLING